MMRMALSPAASGLLRALLNRAQISRDRILLTEFRSTDWQSLTFVGERHEIELRIPGPDAEPIVDQLTTGLEEAEFSIRGHIVADIKLIRRAAISTDGSYSLAIEALTVEE